MTLTELQALNPNLTTARLQQAYFEIVKKIRLHPVLVPVYMRPMAQVDGFNYPARLRTTLSEFAIKEIVSFDCITESEVQSSNVVAESYLTILDPRVEYYGLTEALWDAVNEEQEEVPDIIWEGPNIECTNCDRAMFLMTAYVYPYFVTYGSPYTRLHYYLISSMVTLYTADNLTVDNLLLFPVVMQAMANYYNEIGNIPEASILHNSTIQMIDLYNENFEQIAAGHLGQAGAITPWKFEHVS